MIELKCEIIWTGGLPHLNGLPYLPWVPHLHVNRPEVRNRSFRYKVLSIQVVSIQAVKLHKIFDHLKYSLRVNKEKILGEYSSFFKP